MVWLKRLYGEERKRLEEGVYAAKWIFVQPQTDIDGLLVSLTDKPLIYFLQHPVNEQWIKVGYSKQVAHRAWELSRDFGKLYEPPYALKFLAFALTEKPKRLETDIHRYFGKTWHIEGEWFQKRRVLYFFGQIKNRRLYDDWKR